MKDQAQETALRVGIDREIEHRRGLDDTVGHTLHLARRLLEDQEVVLAEKNDSDRLRDARVEHHGDFEVRIEYLDGNAVCGRAGDQAQPQGSDSP
jgi:hypothetical protein